MEKNDKKSQEEMFMEAYEEVADAVFRRCYFKTSDRDTAHDLTQDTFMKTWDYMIVRGKEVSNVKAFVFTVANNLIKDYYKKKKSIPFTTLDINADFFSDVEGKIEKYAEFEQAISLLNHLEDSDRDLIMMRYVEGMSPREIAEILGERENTISVRIYRAKQKFQEIIKEMDNGDDL